VGGGCGAVVTPPVPTPARRDRALASVKQCEIARRLKRSDGPCRVGESAAAEVQGAHGSRARFRKSQAQAVPIAIGGLLQEAAVHERDDDAVGSGGSSHLKSARVVCQQETKPNANERSSPRLDLVW